MRLFDALVEEKRWEYREAIFGRGALALSPKLAASYLLVPQTLSFRQLDISTSPVALLL